MVEQRIVVDARLPWGSGIGRYVANCVPRVARLLDTYSFEIIVAEADLFQASDVFSASSNVAVRESAIRPFSVHEQWSAPDLFSGAGLTWFTNYVVPLRWSGRSIVTVHDLLHLKSELFPANAVKRCLVQQTFRHVAKCADAIAFGSRFTEREFTKRFGLARQSAVIGYGIDHDGWCERDPAHQLPKSRELLLVAAQKQHKNFEMAIRAFRDARIDPAWILQLITPDDRLRSAVNIAPLIGDDGRVVLKKAVSNAELSRLYDRSAILLMPSHYEGFGLPLLEAMRAGAQCISSAADALIEVGLGGVVTYVNSDDRAGWSAAIEKECARFDNGYVRMEERKENMRHARSYRWDEVAGRTASLIEAVLASR